MCNTWTTPLQTLGEAIIGITDRYEQTNYDIGKIQLLRNEITSTFKDHGVPDLEFEVIWNERTSGIYLEPKDAVTSLVLEGMYRIGKDVA